MHTLASRTYVSRQRGAGFDAWTLLGHFFSRLVLSSEPPWTGALVANSESKGKVYLAVPYEDRIEAGHRGAKWDPEQKLWYIGPRGTRASLAKWLPENAARPEPVSDPREEFAAVLRELGADLSGQHSDHGRATASSRYVR